MIDGLSVLCRDYRTVDMTEGEIGFEVDRRAISTSLNVPSAASVGAGGAVTTGGGRLLGFLAISDGEVLFSTRGLIVAEFSCTVPQHPHTSRLRNLVSQQKTILRDQVAQ